MLSLGGIMSDQTIQSLIQNAPQVFMAERAEGVNAVVHFHLTGEQGGDWGLTIKDQRCLVTQGVPPNPTLTLTADAKDALGVLTGKIDGVRAFMMGKLKLTGDFKLAMKLTSFYKFN
jgi:putative sterol carrier protein